MTSARLHLSSAPNQHRLSTVTSRGETTYPAIRFEFNEVDVSDFKDNILEGSLVAGKQWKRLKTHDFVSFDRIAKAVSDCQLLWCSEPSVWLEFIVGY